jgi:carbon storage regulator
MLILSRRINEIIRIGADISVKILEIHGNQVKIGIDAPKPLPVHRDEIYERIKKASEP